MKVDLGTIVNSQVEFQELIEMKMKATVAYRLAKIHKVIHGELESFDSVRNNLIRELGEETEDGNFTVKPENISNFMEQHQELLNQEVEIGFDKILIGDLISSSGDELDISAKLLEKLEWLISD